jgi:hypothetical protein
VTVVTAAPPDHRDLALEELAASEARLVDRVQELESENHSLRELLSEAISAVARLTADLHRSSATASRLREEFVEFRARVMRAGLA